MLSLIWTVLGGITFGIYIGKSILYNVILLWYTDDIKDLNKIGVFFRSTANVLVLVKLTTKNMNNNCGIHWLKNDLLLIFIVSSWITYIFDTFFVFMLLF